MTTIRILTVEEAQARRDAHPMHLMIEAVTLPTYGGATEHVYNAVWPDGYIDCVFESDVPEHLRSEHDAATGCSLCFRQNTRPVPYRLTLLGLNATTEDGGA